MKRTITAIFAILVLVMSIAVIADSQDSAPVTLGTGNSVPVCDVLVTNPSPITLTSCAADTNTFVFNVTDANGYADLNDTTAFVTLSKGGETDRTSASCTIQNEAGNYAEYSCDVDSQYYDGSGVWTVTFNVTDDSGESCQDTDSVTINSLDDTTIDDSSISCGTGVAPGTADQACDTQTINNCGNVDYGSINMTGYDLNGTLGGGSDNNIDATALCVNDANDANTGCDTLADSAPVTLTGGVLAHGSGATETVYQFIDVPSGLLADTYTSTSNYVYDMIV